MRYIFGADSAPFSLTQNQLYSEKEEMTCFSCLNPRTKDIRVDIDTARPTTDSSGSLLSLSLFFYMKAEIVFIIYLMLFVRLQFMEVIQQEQGPFRVF